MVTLDAIPFSKKLPACLEFFAKAETWQTLNPTPFIKLVFKDRFMCHLFFNCPQLFYIIYIFPTMTICFLVTTKEGWVMVIMHIKFADYNLDQITFLNGLLVY